MTMNLLPNKLFNRINFRGNPENNRIYLTFDDGPHPENTPRLHELLAQLDIKVTFFLQGENVEKHPEIAKAAAEAGHSLQNHGFYHRALSFCSKDEIEKNICETNSIIEKITNSTPTCVRPPYGRFGWNAFRVCQRLDMKIVLWNNMPFDFLPQTTSRQIVSRIKKNLSPGSIIVLHDNVPFEKHAESLPEITAFARKQGFSFDIL